VSGETFYDDRADWWLLLSPVSEYADEAARYIELMQRHGPLKSVLELGSGGGNVAWYFKRHFEMTLTDLSPAMLAESEKLNPDCGHAPGDMRTLRLGRTFDGVFVHDAVMSMVTADDLEAAIRTAFEHLRPGGVALFCPDFVTDGFAPYTECGGFDGEDGRSLRYLEWVRDARPAEERVRWSFTFNLQHADGTLETFVDDGDSGLFSEARWVELFEKVGFEVELHRADAPENLPGEGPPGQVQFLARRPG